MMPPGLPAAGPADATVSFWQPVDPAFPVIDSVRYQSWTTFATGRRIMIVRDRGGQQDRLAVTADDVRLFTRLPAVAGGTDAAGNPKVLTQALPAIDLSGAPGFWVVIGGVSLAGSGQVPVTRQAPAEFVTFADAIPDAAAWFRTVARSSVGSLLRPTVAMLATPCLDPADVTRDGRLDGADLGAILGAWGLPDPLCDLDRNGVVAGGDLAIFLAAWSNR